MQWLIDLVIEKVISDPAVFGPAIEAKIGQQGIYIDRGESVGVDFTIGDWVKDGLWHDKDFSGIVPANAVAMSVIIVVATNVADGWLRLKRGGSDANSNISECRAIVANLQTVGDYIVAVPANRIIQYSAANLTYFALTLTVKGWWLGWDW